MFFSVALLSGTEKELKFGAYLAIELLTTALPLFGSGGSPCELGGQADGAVLIPGRSTSPLVLRGSDKCDMSYTGAALRLLHWAPIDRQSSKYSELQGAG